MLKFYETSTDENSECDICFANNEFDYSVAVMDIWIINTHCIELRRNREARKNKNIKPKKSVF